jgi:hypothetical protein
MDYNVERDLRMAVEVMDSTTKRERHIKFEWFCLGAIFAMLLTVFMTWLIYTSLPVKHIAMPTPAPTVMVTVAPTVVPTIFPTITISPTKAVSVASRSVNIAAKEFDLFCHIVAKEAAPQWKNGKVDYQLSYLAALDVATVIMNRTKAGHWGKTITSVVSAPGQFTTYDHWWWSTPQDYEVAAVKDVLAGKRSLPSYVLYFCTPDSYEASDFFPKLVIINQRYGHILMAEKGEIN